jgi:hypothetical protein
MKTPGSIPVIKIWELDCRRNQRTHMNRVWAGKDWQQIDALLRGPGLIIS